MNKPDNINSNIKASMGYTPMLGAVAVSVLFVRRDSIYKELGVDCWDIDRNALNWRGKNPIIAHPPCRAWGQLSHFAKPLPGEKELAIWSIHQIRKYGGVLEHPRASRLWKELKLPLRSEIDNYGGFTMSVDQFWWGHKARKRSLLYICGCKAKDMPAHPLRFETPEYVVSTSKVKNGKRKKEITRKEREATPIELAKWLIEVASRCSKSHCT